MAPCDRHPQPTEYRTQAGIYVSTTTLWIVKRGNQCDQTQSDHSHPLEYAQRAWIEAEHVLGVQGIRHQRGADPESQEIRQPSTQEFDSATNEIKIDIFDRGVPHIFAVDHVDDVFPNILGVITDTL